MSDAAGLDVSFASLAGTAENRWIRLEQVGAPVQAITFAEAADLIDSLYGTSPCDNDGETGTGGEAADDSALPDERNFLQAATSRLRITACADDNGYWPVDVDVLRSHQEGGWRLVSGTDGVEIGESVVLTGRKHEVVELESPTSSHDLAYPYFGDLRVSGARVASVRGSTVNFTRPVTGRVTLSYTAIWDRVTVRVPATANEQGLYRAEPCGVIAFWHRLAAPLTLEQPEDDTTLATLRRICPRYRFRHEGDCFETIEHYQRCNCSHKEAAGAWTETVSAVCPDGTSAGAWLGQRRVLDGYTDCPGEEDKFSDPDFYTEKCCEEPKGTLPRCEVERDRYQGGAEIEGGPEPYRERYGPDVRLTAITPEGGDCGEIIRTWRYTPGWAASGGPQLPSLLYVTPGSSFRVTISGGRAPSGGWQAATWEASSGISGPTSVQYVDDAVAFRTTSSFREGKITVTDACGRQSNVLQIRTAQKWAWRPGSDAPFDCGKNCCEPRCNCTECYPGAPYHLNPALARAVVTEYYSEAFAPGVTSFPMSPGAAETMSSLEAPRNGVLLFSKNEDSMIFVQMFLGSLEDCYDDERNALHDCAPCNDVIDRSICDEVKGPLGGVVKVGNIEGSWIKRLVWATP